MKTQFGILLGIIMTFSLKAQDCPNYYPLSQGSNWELTQYSKKDKVEGISRVAVNTFATTASGYLANLAITSSDDKGKDQGTAEVTMKCENGIFYFDMRNFLSPATTEAYKDMEVEVTASDMQYPNNLTVGSVLPDASITYKVSSNGFAMMTMTVNISNRKVIGQESIVTPAGTFNAYKISFNVDTKTGMIKTNVSVVEYLATGYGVVKSENYNNKGELMSYSLLTKIEIK